MSYNLPPGLTPAYLRAIARLLAHPRDGEHLDEANLAALDLDLWANAIAVAPVDPPTPAVTWSAIGGGDTLAIEEGTGRVLGAISQGQAGTFKTFKWSAWDRTYTSYEAARAAFEKSI